MRITRERKHKTTQTSNDMRSKKLLSKIWQNDTRNK